MSNFRNSRFINNGPREVSRSSGGEPMDQHTYVEPEVNENGILDLDGNPHTAAGNWVEDIERGPVGENSDVAESILVEGGNYTDIYRDDAVVHTEISNYMNPFSELGFDIAANNDAMEQQSERQRLVNAELEKERKKEENAWKKLMAKCKKKFNNSILGLDL